MQRIPPTLQISLRAGFLITLAFVVAVACSEVILLDTEGSPSMLVVDGRLSDGDFGSELTLARTSIFNVSQTAVSGAQITLIEDGVPIAGYVEYEIGSYRMVYPNDSARIGRAYELLIELPDGSRYGTLPSVMPRAAVRDNLRFEVGIEPVQINETGLTQDRRLASVYGNSTVLLPEEDFYLRWDILETYILEERLRPTAPFEPIPVPCYVTNNITTADVRLFDGSELKVETIPEVLLATSIIDSRFADAYFFNVVSSNMDERAYEYYARVDEMANLQGQIFDPPPAPIPGNVFNLDDPEEQVLGFFLVANSDTSHIKISINDIPFNVPIPCPDWNRLQEPAYCTECELFENSTTRVPFFWY